MGSWLLAPAIALALGFAVLAAALLARAAEEHDLGERLRSVLRAPEPSAAPARAAASSFLAPLLRLGEALRDSAFFAEKDAAQLQRALAAAGLDARRAVPAFIGAKAVLLLLLPAAAVAWALMAHPPALHAGLAVFGALVAAVFLPNLLLDVLRRPFQNSLRKGLPDALDLLVVSAEAGLGLESAVDRVAQEMAGSNRAIALEMTILVQELRLLPDRRMALQRMGERTGMESFRRLGATLSQTLRYGTPLAAALRTLAAEMREERMLRIEEKAIRLPALLIGPLILFILPALFIALIGPSVVELGNSMGGSR